MNTETEFRKLKGMVYSTLQEVEETRNSDITLMIKIWERYYSYKLKESKTGKKVIYLDDLYDLPREDNIKRIRAKIQNEQNIFLPTIEKVRHKRLIKEEDWLKWLDYSRINNKAYEACQSSFKTYDIQ